MKIDWEKAAIELAEAIPPRYTRMEAVSEKAWDRLYFLRMEILSHSTADAVSFFEGDGL